MHLGIATDRGGFRLKEDLLARLREAGHDVVDFGATALNREDDRVMRFDSADPIWANRDRFVLSNGHASMLLWSMLVVSASTRIVFGLAARSSNRSDRPPEISTTVENSGQSNTSKHL